MVVIDQTRSTDRQDQLSSWIGSMTVLAGACLAFGVISLEERRTLIAMLRRANSKGSQDASGPPPVDPAP